MWWTKNLLLKPVMQQMSSISSVIVPYSVISMSSNLSSIFARTPFLYAAIRGSGASDPIGPALRAPGSSTKKPSGSIGNFTSASPTGYRSRTRLSARRMLSARTATEKRAAPLRTSTQTFTT
jgi:hypothetical protein